MKGILDSIFSGKFGSLAIFIILICIICGIIKEVQKEKEEKEKDKKLQEFRKDLMNKINPMLISFFEGQSEILYSTFNMNWLRKEVYSLDFSKTLNIFTLEDLKKNSRRFSIITIDAYLRTFLFFATKVGKLSGLDTVNLKFYEAFYKSINLIFKDIFPTRDFFIDASVLNELEDELDESFRKFGSPFKILESIVDKIDNETLKETRKSSELLTEVLLCELTISKKTKQNGKLSDLLFNSPVNYSANLYEDLDEFCFKISEKIGLVKDTSQWDSVLTQLQAKRIDYFTKEYSLSARKTLLDAYAEVASGFAGIKQNEKSQISFDENSCIESVILNFQTNMYLLFNIELSKCSKDLIYNNSDKIKEIILDDSINFDSSKLMDAINDENVEYFFDNYKTGTTNINMLSKIVDVCRFVKESIWGLSPKEYIELNQLAKVSQIRCKYLANIYLFCFYCFISKFPDNKNDELFEEFRELILLNPFDVFSDEEFFELTTSENYYNTLSEVTIELYKRFGL